MRGFTRWVVALFMSPVGVVILAALDSTVFFTLPFGIDAVVILMVARSRALAWAVPLLATGGSLAGAVLTYWLGVQIGEKGLDRYVRPSHVERIRSRVRQTGAIAVAMLDLLPPPFPFSACVLAAGALEVDPSRFFMTLAICRLIRFGGEALLALHYGKRILSWLEGTTAHDVAVIVVFGAIAASVYSLVQVVQQTRAGSTRGKPPEASSRARVLHSPE